jgi:hypothetical protein
MITCPYCKRKMTQNYYDKWHTPCPESPEFEDEERGDGMTDVEADADTLRNAGWGTDEDYGGTDERY